MQVISEAPQAKNFHALVIHYLNASDSNRSAAGENFLTYRYVFKDFTLKLASLEHAHNTINSMQEPLMHEKNPNFLNAREFLR